MDYALIEEKQVNWITNVRSCRGSDGRIKKIQNKTRKKKNDEKVGIFIE